MFDRVLNTHLQSATCLGKLRTLIRLIQLQCKFTHLKIQTQLPYGFFDSSKTILNKLKLRACVRYFLSNFYFSPNNSPSKTTKNDFYFI